MIFGVILAGGKGSRMEESQKSKIPKQFLNLGGKPVFLYSLETFLKSDKIDSILLVCPSEYSSLTAEIIGNWLKEGKNTVNLKKIETVKGGNTRNESLLNAVAYIEDNYGSAVFKEAIVVSHDGARPFVTERMIEESLEGLKEFEASTCAVKAADTTVLSKNGREISGRLNRDRVYRLQTPQTFIGRDFKYLYFKLSTEQKKLITDVTGIFSHFGKSVALVGGSIDNLKITYSHEMEIAEGILKRILTFRKK